MFADAYTQELIDFTEAVRDKNTSPSPGAEDARKALRVALAAMKSHEESRPVQLKELP
jgi:myo-inositol 2-dehydrogenase/D-chiro-inositol 1-dehydrogenase